MNTEITYYLVRFDSINAKEDFEKMVSTLSTIPGIIVTPSGVSEIAVSYKDHPQSGLVRFRLNQAPTALGSGHQSSMLVTCQKADRTTVELFRKLAQKFQYRLYSTSLQCFLPRHLDILDMDQVVLTEKGNEVFSKKGFRPMFTFPGSDVYFAQNLSDQTIHLLNEPLMKFFLGFGVDEKPNPEFSYPVAPNLVEFVALFDQNLIPTAFYEYFQKSLKIINYSFFDILNLKRKVFIKPFFFEYHNKRQEYLPVASEKSALNYADKARIGETLHMALTRIVKDDLKLAPDYFRAKVFPKIDFDRDREGILTPRLWINIYLKDMNRSEEFITQSQRGWTSLTDQRAN